MQILRKAWETWKRVGQFIADIVARVVLTVFYFTIFLPFGVGVRLLGDRLDTKSSRPAHWLERSTYDKSVEQARRLF